MPSSSLIRRAVLAFVACFVLGVVLFWKVPSGEFPGMVANDCIVLDDGSVDCSGMGGVDGEMPPCELPVEDVGSPSFDTNLPAPLTLDTATNTTTTTTNTNNSNSVTPTAPAESGDGSFFGIFNIFSGQVAPDGKKLPKPCFIPPPKCVAQEDQDGKVKPETCKDCKNSCDKCQCENGRKPGDPPITGDKCKDKCDLTDCCDKMPDPKKCKDGRDGTDDQACKDDPKKCSCKQKYDEAVKKCYIDKNKKENTNCWDKCLGDIPGGVGPPSKACLDACTACEKKAADDANACAGKLCTIDGGTNVGGGNNVGRPGGGGGFAGLGGGFQGAGGAGGDLGGSGGTPGGSTGASGTTGGSTGTSGTSGTNGTTGGTDIGGIGGDIGGIGPVAPAPGSSSSRASSVSSTSRSSTSSSTSSTSSSQGSSGSKGSSSTSSTGTGSSSSSGGNPSCQNCQYCTGASCNQQLCYALGGGTPPFPGVCDFNSLSNTCTPNPQRCGSSSSALSSTSSTTSSTSSRASSTSSTITIGCSQCTQCGTFFPCNESLCKSRGPCIYDPNAAFICSPDPAFCATSSSSSKGSSGSSQSSTGSTGSSSSTGSTSSTSSRSSTSSTSSSRSSSVSSSSRSSSSSSASSARNGCTGLECILGGGAYCATTNRTCVLNFDNLPACFDCIARNSSSSSDSFFSSSTPFNDIGGTVGGTIGGTVGGQNGTVGGENGTVGGGDMGGIGGIEGIPNASFGSSSSRNLQFCGNGTVNSEFGEQCDMGNLNNDALPDRCRTDCLVPRCGDRVIDSGEQCDEGALNGHTDVTPCDSQCRRSTYESPPPPSTVATSIDLPLLPGQYVNPLTGQVESSLTTIATSNPPAGQEGPAALAAMAAGASAGFAWLRRRKALSGK